MTDLYKITQQELNTTDFTCEFENFLFENLQIYFVDFRGAVIKNCKFVECDFLHCCFDRSRLEGVNMSNCTISNCSFKGVYLENCNAQQVSMESTNIHSITNRYAIVKCNSEHAKLDVGANFRHCFKNEKELLKFLNMEIDNA